MASAISVTLHQMRLTPAQQQQFATRGYVVVDNVIPKSLVADSVSAITTNLGVELDDPTSWYPGSKWTVPLYQHAAFWAVREHPDVHDIFAQLLGGEQLWVSIDRASFKAPIRDEDEVKAMGNFIHFDMNPLEGEMLQGVVCLTDTSEEQGGFQCVPESLKDPERWMSRADFDKENLAFTDLATLPIERPTAKAGDLVVFTSRLAHGNGANRAGSPRIAQYVTMRPVGNEEERQDRVNEFNARLPPKWFRDKNSVPEPGPSPTLSELGRKLLGSQSWN